jgi:hypothetical protein
MGDTLLERMSALGYSRERVGKDGKSRWMACYTDATGKKCSAGTFATERQADKAWQRAESKVSEGRQTGRQQFRRYVTEVWFPNHRIERSTRRTTRTTWSATSCPSSGLKPERDPSPRRAQLVVAPGGRWHHALDDQVLPVDHERDLHHGAQ